MAQIRWVKALAWLDTGQHRCYQVEEMGKCSIMVSILGSGIVTDYPTINSRTASFSEDACGRWYFNVVVYVKVEPSKGLGSVGIDLGCKASATDSNGEAVHGREYRTLEPVLVKMQRVNNKHRVKAINAKIRNCRQDSLHKYSRKVVNDNAAIFVGNVKSLSMIKTKQAKSVLDAGWGSPKTMLEYNSIPQTLSMQKSTKLIPPRPARVAVQ